MREKPVYLFNGFLGCGKTTFIMDTLSTPDFGAGEKTLLLLCEEGEVEYDTSKFCDEVHIVRIEEESDLTEARLNGIASRYKFDRVLVEYNGMWMTDTLFQSMPRNWIIAQEMTFFDANTFLLYNQNMRQLVFNKMQTAELVVFNRCTHGFDKMAFHREVRVANRRATILYEYGPYDIERDEIEDPLPFDKEAARFTVKDEDYAEWYRDINEKQDDYEGKVITVKGRVAKTPELEANKFAFGRHVMTCCVEDIQFCGLIAVSTEAESFKNGEWVAVTAKVKNVPERAYGEVGPVLYCQSVKRCDPADPEVATFY